MYRLTYLERQYQYNPQSKVYRYPSPEYTRSEAFVYLNYGAIPTRWGAYGICIEATGTCPPVGYGWPLCIDPPGSGDTDGRQFSARADQSIFVFGKLFDSTTGKPLGKMPVKIVFKNRKTGVVVKEFSTITGEYCGEANVFVRPGTIPPGEYEVRFVFEGS
ncbi:MAG: hypothetical protein QW253_00155 [Metallosphaera sp.]